MKARNFLIFGGAASAKRVWIFCVKNENEKICPKSSKVLGVFFRCESLQLRCLILPYVL